MLQFHPMDYLYSKSIFNFTTNINFLFIIGKYTTIIYFAPYPQVSLPCIMPEYCFEYYYPFLK